MYQTISLQAGIYDRPSIGMTTMITRTEGEAKQTPFLYGKLTPIEVFALESSTESGASRVCSYVKAMLMVHGQEQFVTHVSFFVHMHP
jgi:hypothetical protein